MFEIELNYLIIIALSLSTLGLLLQMGIYWGLFSRLAWYKAPEIPSGTALLPPVSVVICAHNERHNLEKYLPDILSQDYDDFEVVVVNDCSDDETEELLTELSRLNPALKIVHLRQSLNFFRSKKFPLSMGIKSAKNEILLLTDADCSPLGKRWITEMVQGFQKNSTEVVLGYGPYKKKNGLLNLLIRFDTLHIAMQYLSFALIGRPYMGVGRNLSYHKSLFLRNKGFTAHYNIPSGDDDLFISQVASKKNTNIVINKDARMYSMPKQSFSSWITQKRRHLSTSPYYHFMTKFALGSIIISQWIFYAGIIVMLFTALPWWLAVSFFMVRLITQMIVTKACAAQLGENKLWLFTPVGDLFFMLFNPALVLTNLIAKPYKWK
ncbi:MAG: glycosyltransferase [Bacteroidales bacterium]|nr:glycosyltransferase [Bacteroidales bacterium]